jgi:hypothetical protein
LTKPTCRCANSARSWLLSPRLSITLSESGDDDGSGDTGVDESDVADTTEARPSVEPVDEIGTGDTDNTGEFGVPTLVESSP